MAGFLMNILGTLGGGSQPQSSPLAGQQMSGVATSDDPNSQASLPGQTIQSTPGQPGFWQQHPRGAQAMSLLFGAKQPMQRPMAPTAAPGTVPAVPTAGPQAPPSPIPQVAGNAANPNNATLNGIIQALEHPVTGSTPFSQAQNLNGYMGGS
jgi:hypothetical protein